VTTSRRSAAPPPHLSLPQLTPFDGDVLEAGNDHDAVDFVDLDFSGQDASDARFLECRFLRCSLDGTSLRRARVVGSLLADANATSLDLGDSTWRDAEISGGRIGAVSLAGASLTGVRVRDGRFGFANLTGAHLDDVIFEGCEVGSLDARSAQLRRVTFIDCIVDELDITAATLTAVDLSGARLRSLIGVESLRGAIIGEGQLMDLAPLLAAQLGLEIRADPGTP
jgi:uncharacterized protein YjbI with pentapeptide repeats